MLIIDLPEWGDLVGLLLLKNSLVLLAVFALELDVDAENDEKDLEDLRDVFDELVALSCCWDDWGNRLA